MYNITITNNGNNDLPDIKITGDTNLTLRNKEYRVNKFEIDITGDLFLYDTKIISTDDILINTNNFYMFAGVIKTEKNCYIKAVNDISVNKTFFQNLIDSFINNGLTDITNELETSLNVTPVVQNEEVNVQVVENTDVNI